MADSIISATATSTAAEGGYAVANYSITGALGIATTVKVTVSGLGGATSLDYSGFQYSMGDLIGDWQTATSGGLITLNAGFTNFQLRVLVNNDTLSEAGEALAFSVAQTTSSVGLADSWWVPSTVNLVDPAGQGASALLRAITASATPTTTAVEAIGTATNINHAAVATFDLSGGGTTTAGSYGSTVVHVGVNGQGGATSLDYSGFSYHMGSNTADAWITVPTTGLITIGSADVNFQLSTNVLYDRLTEASESLLFAVAQTTNSNGLTDSWSVQSTVDLADADPAHNVYTGAMGRDHFVATGAAEIFVIPANTSVTNNGVGATGVFAGDIGGTFFGTDYDTITNFSHGSDKIDLPSGVNVTLVTTAIWAGTEETLIDLYWLPTDAAFTNFFGAGNSEAGSDAIVWRLNATDTYFLFVDSNNDEQWNSATDAFIKFIGSPALSTTDFI